MPVTPSTGSRSCERSARPAAQRCSSYTDRTFAMHRGGKIEQHNKYPLKTRDDLSMAYTPGVARVCTTIAQDRVQGLRVHDQEEHRGGRLRRHARCSGLGDIGPEAAMPVMEGKAMLFKEFAGVDAFPICLDTKDPEEIVQTVEADRARPSAASTSRTSPRRAASRSRIGCKATLDIPVFHDDQHGTAVVVLAALFNAAEDRRQADRGAERGHGRRRRRRGRRAPRCCSPPASPTSSAATASGAVSTERDDYHRAGCRR